MRQVETLDENVLKYMYFSGTDSGRGDTDTPEGKTNKLTQKILTDLKSEVAQLPI